MDKHEAMQVLTEMRDNLQHNYKVHQQTIEMNDKALILMALSKKISALTMAMNYLDHYGTTP